MGRRLKVEFSPNRARGSWNPDQVLSRALAERERFLAANPRHRKLQREIDRTLDKAGTAENRMAVLALLIEAKLIELHHQLWRLNRILITVAT